MPMPVGGAFALGRMGHRGYSNNVDTYDPELEEYREQQKYIQDNVKCTLNFYRSMIPPKGGKLEGLMVMEARKDVEHSGMFILMKGLPPGPKKTRGQSAKTQPQQSTNYKFTVLGSTYSGGAQEVGGECMQIEQNSRETYPLALKLPDELPPPLITADGRLTYRMQVFVSTVEGRHVSVAEMPIRWLGCRVLTKEEIGRSLKLEQLVTSKRAYLGLGKKKCCQVEWKCGQGGYLPGEVIPIELRGYAKEKITMELECSVELVQKVWYQVPSTNSSRGGKLWVKMKVNVLWTAGTNGDCVEVEGEDKQVIWRGALNIPRGITPTVKFDFTNSVSYTVRVGVGLAGESKDCWVTGEVPILIGSGRERDAKEKEGNGTIEEDDEDYDSASPVTPQSPGSRASISPVPSETTEVRRGSGGAEAGIGTRRSMSMNFVSNWVRPRAGSVSSMESLASSTLSIFNLPPSYSQLSSRRPTLETLPPHYTDLVLPDPWQVDNDQKDEQPSCSSTPLLAAVDAENGHHTENDGKEIETKDIQQE